MITFKSITNVQALLYVYENRPTVASFTLIYDREQLNWLLQNRLADISDKPNPRWMSPTPQAEVVVTALLNTQVDENLLNPAPTEARPKTTTKPPLGVMPYRLWLELHRDELIAAIDRYNKVQQKVPDEWYRELVKTITYINGLTPPSNEPSY